MAAMGDDDPLATLRQLAEERATLEKQLELNRTASAVEAEARIAAMTKKVEVIAALGVSPPTLDRWILQARVTGGRVVGN